VLLGVDERGHIAVFAEQPRGAAHSMDTDWYAVDRNGHVARLSSGEEGAVPWDAHSQYWSDLYEDLAVARVAALAATTGARRVLALDPAIHAVDIDDLPYEWDGVLHFADRQYLEMFRAEYYHQHWRVIDGLPETVAVKDILNGAFVDYWAAGAIVGAFVTGAEVKPAALGLFEYACGFSGPYQRRAVPPEPIHIDRLPEPLRGKLGQLRLGKLDFNTTTDFDPATFLRCNKYRQ
jgi:hypothetical protein